VVVSALDAAIVPGQSLRSVRRVLLDDNALCVAWFGAAARNPRPRQWSTRERRSSACVQCGGDGRARGLAPNVTWKELERARLSGTSPVCSGLLRAGEETQRSWVMAERNVSRVINGVTLRGTYSVKDGIVTVRTPLGSKSSQVGRRSKPGSVAYILLRELFYDVSSDAPEQPQ
jgi:hypothetical protein